VKRYNLTILVEREGMDVLVEVEQAEFSEAGLAHLPSIVSSMACLVDQQIELMEQAGSTEVIH
jgi:hypothetical protein